MIQRNKRSSRRSRPRKWSAHCCVVSRWRRRWSCTRHGFEGWGRKVGEALKREILLEMGPFGRGYPMITWQDLTYIWSNVCLYMYRFLHAYIYIHIHTLLYLHVYIFTGLMYIWHQHFPKAAVWTLRDGEIIDIPYHLFSRRYMYVHTHTRIHNILP